MRSTANKFNRPDSFIFGSCFCTPPTKVVSVMDVILSKTPGTPEYLFHELKVAVLKLLKGERFVISNEKALQSDMATLFDRVNATELVKIPYEREKALSDDKSIIDFFIDGIGIEVKIKGRKVDIYKQVDRYLKCPEIRVLILVTTKVVPLSGSIGGRDVFVVNLNKAWL